MMRNNLERGKVSILLDPIRSMVRHIGGKTKAHMLFGISMIIGSLDSKKYLVKMYLSTSRSTFEKRTQVQVKGQVLST